MRRKPSVACGIPCKKVLEFDDLREILDSILPKPENTFLLEEESNKGSFTEVGEIVDDQEKDVCECEEEPSALELIIDHVVDNDIHSTRTVESYVEIRKSSSCGDSNVPVENRFKSDTVHELGDNVEDGSVVVCHKELVENDEISFSDSAREKDVCLSSEEEKIFSYEKESESFSSFGDIQQSLRKEKEERKEEVEQDLSEHGCVNRTCSNSDMDESLCDVQLHTDEPNQDLSRCDAKTAYKQYKWSGRSRKPKKDKDVEDSCGQRFLRSDLEGRGEWPEWMIQIAGEADEARPDFLNVRLRRVNQAGSGNVSGTSTDGETFEKKLPPTGQREEGLSLVMRQKLMIENRLQHKEQKPTYSKQSNSSVLPHTD